MSDQFKRSVYFFLFLCLNKIFIFLSSGCCCHSHTRSSTLTHTRAHDQTHTHTRTRTRTLARTLPGGWNRLLASPPTEIQPLLFFFQFRISLFLVGRLPWALFQVTSIKWFFWQREKKMDVIKFLTESRLMEPKLLKDDLARFRVGGVR